MNKYMRRYNSLQASAQRMLLIATCLILHISFFITPVRAQDVIVTLTPVQEILPPQALLYVSDPGKYFNVVLTNTSQQPQDVYLAMQLQQSMPASGLSISTPPKRQPQRPFTIPANGTRQLTMMEIKTLFNHIPSSEISTTPGLFDSYNNGSFGLLPEGQYEARLTAYRWASPQLAAPVVVSNPAGGVARFTVCYKAQAPQFLTPVSTSVTLENNNVAELDALVPMFTWTPPVLACNSRAVNYKYSFKIVEVMKNQNPDDAMERNPVVYKADNLMAAQCIIPSTVINAQFYTDRTYAAQVTATSTATGVLNYMVIENEGKSTFRLFRIKTGDMNEKEVEKPEVKPTPKEQDKDKDKDKDKDEGFDISFGDDDLSGSISKDSLYTFSLPTLTSPAFPEEGGARKMFMGAGIKVEWIAPHFLGGEGKDPGSIKMAYDVEIYGSAGVACLKDVLATEPIYKKHTTELEDSIPWDVIKNTVENGAYMAVRVNPVVTKGSSVAFMGDSTHIRDFALIELLSKKFFQCSNMVDITNTSPTKKSASDLKGKEVKIGEYVLTIDEISAGKKNNTWKGKGHVLWQPMGLKVHVCVEFDELAINTDDQVYDGQAVTYSQNKSQSSIEVVDKLFSDWGIDNLISDTGIPYANELQGTATGKVKDIAKKIDLAKYYGYVKKGQAVVSAFLTGEVKDLYMPLALPKSINKSPVDIQIVSMKFAATHATMDVLGEFTLPNSKYTKNDILVLGAPRLCISPNRVLPESGTVALLSDFTIKDPKSSYEMTFKAPKNVLEPENGCYVSWHDDKFEILGIDLDMKIPGLVKDKDGSPTKENPTLNIQASIADWDDWMIDNLSIDPFQAEALPGWTFTATDIVYDHSYYRNSAKMGAFPKGYVKSKAGITGVVTDKEGKQYKVTGDKDWQGLFIKQIGIKFPKALEIGTKGDKRLSISANNFFIDKSGASLEVTSSNLLSAKTGKLGGWDFSLDKVYATFVQNNFNDCGFNGKFSVPLLKGQIAYDCKVKKLTSNANNASQYAFLFKTQQVDGLSLDFFLANATFKKDQTYFLLESAPNSKGTMETNVELMMGGDLTIGGTDYLNKKIKNSNLPMKFEIPGVHFCGMRLANCKSTWTSKYESDMQKKAKNASLSGKTIYSGKEFDLASGKIYFSTGKWSLASPSKKLGPFEFSLDKYKFDYKNKKLSTSLEGSIKFIDGIELSASAGITINANVTLPSDLKNLSKINVSYGNTDFDKVSVGTKFAGMEIDGSLTAARSNDREGYEGKLKFKMPGNLFYIDANGGYFKKKSENSKFTYGWFYASAGGKAGIPIDPAKIHRISAGFYYNCKRNGTSADPEEGIIGVIAGLGISTSAGEDMMSGDFDMTVIYDSKKKRLSTMLMSGKLQAMADLVKAEANILYQHDNTNQFLQVDVTVDASADAEKLTSKVAGSSTMKSLGDLKKKLNSSYTKLTKKVAADGLAGKVDDKKTNSDPSTSSPSKGSNLSASAGAKISLQFKITMKEKGRQLDKAKWHVYLGEPEISKRCVYTFLKVNSSILKINIGANGYVCVGNELPNNGKLPDIPIEIRKFLDGSTSGKGIESADVSKANRARDLSLKEFNDQIGSIGGGVMFGGQIYGYFDVDLGIFYMDAGATAGFDVSLIKLPANAYCVNLSGKPGWKGWYGYGQLYAYLYAKFGIRINLGFWKKDFDVADAGIGGVFRMQGPKPTHFDGEARVKLKLLGGLVDINRKYQFSAGDDCDLFVGNALDNFKLFGDLTIGYDNKEKGWADKNKIDPNLLTRPCFYTEAPLKEPFRVLDETELSRLKKNYDGDPSDLEMEASRTFIFRSNVESKVTLKEYTSKNSSRYNTRTFYLKGQSRYANYIDITSLNPNCYYVMEVSGYAKEIVKGKESDPLKYNERTNKYVPEAWKQTKTYYFATGPSKAIEDVPELQDYIAIAYPSNCNQIKHQKDDTKYMFAHKSDVQYPTFALTTNLQNKAFKKGTLRWRLYNSSNKLICSRNNKWVTTSSTCNMQPESGFTGVDVNGYYKMKLEYETSSRVNNKVVTNTDIIAEIWVKALNSTWKEGYDNGYSTYYEKPFVGCRINSVTWSDVPRVIEDFHMARDPRYSLFDPYLYIGYLSNYAFPGGWEFDADRMDINVTTAQSVIYTDKGGVYEGKLGSSSNAKNAGNDRSKIMALSIYDKSQWSKLCKYPLPVLDGQFGYALTGLERAAVYRPSSKRYVQVQGYIRDMYGVYQAADYFSSRLMNYCKDMNTIDVSYNNFTKRANALDSWYQARRGQYASAKYLDARLQVPVYQFPIIYGSCLDNSGSKKKITMWGTLKGYAAACKKFDYARGHEGISEWIFCGLLGSDKLGGGYVDKKNRHSRDAFVNNSTVQKRMKSANFSIYRVNAYDFNDCNYTVSKSANGGYEESFDLSYPLTYFDKK